MSLPWKILLALAVVLPLGGFVVGSLASAADDDPLPRQPIVLREGDESQAPSDAPSPSPGPRSGESRNGSSDDDVNDPDDHVVSPKPYEDGDDDSGDDHGTTGEEGDDGGDDGDDDDDGDGDD
ncbi:hypothetical protein HNR19_001677 [Nocardioides thalensis]|uniref:Small secreted hydrophilic protein n=1 Tax=Nocardioides thalensis TaxID=1914755 RepID=A0A853C0S5_9ACTN|nr:hypothetical protein [Nocardioides thalensis]NYJ00979.1 hypothetical protein [Nocardioides thalensis]